MKKVLFFSAVHFGIFIIGAFIARLAFVISNISFSSSLLETLSTFWYGLPLDFSIAGYTLIPALLMTLVSNKKSSLFLFHYYFYLMLIFFVINSIDAELFAHWGSRINLIAILYVNNIGGAMASVDTKAVILFLTTTILQAIIFYFILKKGFFKNPLKWVLNRSEYSQKSILIVLCLMAFSFVVARGGLGKVPINQSRVVFSTNQYLNAASINGFWNFFYYISNQKDHSKYEDFVYKEDGALENFFKENLEHGTELVPPLFDLNNKKKPNIVLLIIESLTAETFQSIGGTLDWSPKLNSLLDSSLVFSQMYASGNRTDKGLAALLSGFPAQPTTSILLEPTKSKELPSVSCELSNVGYDNTFIYGGDISFANMGFYLRNICFNTIIDQNSISSKSAKGAWGYHDQDLFVELKKQIKNQKKNSPFFISALSLSVHEPFDVPKVNNKASLMELSYRYSDSCIVDFVNWFKESEYFENTIVVITGDHGRDVGVDYGQFFGKEKFHIPCIMIGGVLNSYYVGKQIDNVVSQTSLMPFIIQNVGLPISNFPFYHHPLSKKPFAIYFFDNGFGLMTEDKYIAWDNNLQSITSRSPNSQPKDSFNVEKNFGLSYQQILMKKYFEFNRK